MKILITGGTGFVGSLLAKRLLESGNEVTILDRTIKKTVEPGPGLSLIEADISKPGEWQKQPALHDAVVNLAGVNVFQRWNPAVKNAIRESRITSTKNLINGLSSGKGKLKLLVNASAVGYYGFPGDIAVDESASAGSDFLAGVCEEWESEAMKAEAQGIRVALCRFGIILGPGGGAIASMVPAFRAYLGAPLGTGRQWFPWVHIEEIVSIIMFIIENKKISGPVNCTAPASVTNAEFTKELAAALGRKAFLPGVPGFILRILFGEVGDLLLKGQRVEPAALKKAGYTFKYPELGAALKSILK
jgi:hypothetical protein